MADSTSYILAAAGIVAANEAIFLPVVTGRPLWKDFNWRIVPVTAVAALSLAGLEKVSPQLGKGLAVLALIGVIVRPLGNAGSPLENASRMLGLQR